MKNKLNVYFFDQLAGELSQDKYGTLSFRYNSDYINSKGTPISYSMPLTKEEYYGNEAHAYFTGLLPEEEMLISAAKAIGTSSLNYFKLLSELGQEPIGAIRMGKSPHEITHQYDKISIEELDEMIMNNDSLMSTLYQERELRLSLAGAQSKTGLFYKNNEYFVPQNGSPSNVIVKPTNKRYNDLVFNEYASMKIAAALGIDTPVVQLKKTQKQSLFMIHRYDRILTDQSIQRLHQEDFCQALGIQNQNKYEADGGPSFKQCINLLRAGTTVPSLEINKFIRLFLFNTIIGNKDAHGKNYSILYINNKQILAPAYDVLSTTFYPELTSKMSMSINGKFELDEITESDLHSMANEANISGNLLIKEYHQLKALILPKAEEVLMENVFPNSFSSSFFHHLKNTHSELF